ncbi:type 1 fimbrial protein [Stenotrophomonas maltophilia]|uniref:fimbrial protein n=1 Tax=Stenotrophomonas maltophilia TaxID=40324 RepID=UPI0015DEE2F9|nr:fimbrial protein [Stenotrophomonas maltophilia]MBA0386492.1 type 1 fimbrial protein [Stenotrophomonas maltophilia]MBA0391880.1 type 1 fimbrial protein [Stenotrophomonas maltophilia]MBA0464324.1 type 1 fimbrial protein [Stenotrophomonas maltophilia]MBA0471702.1 type 1 fimbrial protein [Stenotrophomonas maltophilia]
MRAITHFGKLCGVLLLGALALPALGQDLTVRFTGRFQPGTCNFSVPNVDLGSYQANTFTGNTVTPWRQVTVTSSNCSSDITHIHMRFSGVADGNNSAYFAVRNTTASGVAIELVNGASQRVTPNVTTFTWSRSGIGPSYNLFARFVQTRPTLTSGSVTTPITISFTYN